LNAASGLENKFRPAPPRVGSPLVPTPFDPAIFALTPLPMFILLIGIAPADMEPTCWDPPHADVDSTTVRGRPLFAEYMSATNHPPTRRSSAAPVAAHRLPRPNGSS